MFPLCLSLQKPIWTCSLPDLVSRPTGYRVVRFCLKGSKHSKSDIQNMCLFFPLESKPLKYKFFLNEESSAKRNEIFLVPLQNREIALKQEVDDLNIHSASWQHIYV